MADIEKLKESFRLEAAELLEEVEQHLLDLENRPDDKDLLKKVYRTAHTLKGTAGMFAFTEVEEFLHLVENFLDAAFNEELTFDHRDISRVFKSIDQTRLLINDADKASAPDEKNLREEISGYIRERLEQTGKSVQAPDAEIPNSVESRKWQIFIRFPASVLENGPSPADLFSELDELGEVRYQLNYDTIPDLQELQPEKCYLNWHITLISDCAEQDIRDVFLFVEDESELTITLDQDTPGDRSKPASSANPNSGNGEQESIKMDSATLDELLNLVGELVINQSRLKNLIGDESSNEMENAVEENERLVDSLQTSVMNMRMLPVDTLALRFRRMIRDMAESMGKEVNFVMQGGETELDKSMLDNLVDPMMHLLRNCIDHGIEQPELRQSLGKSPQGTITISASQEGGEFVLKLFDDGSGIDPDAVFTKALEKGLVSSGEQLTDDQKLNLIFKPGFSTSEQVTNVSGRGIGMDVVKRAIDNMNGNISITSEKGKFSEFTIRLPLTLAITECLLVKTGKQVYGIPVSYIERVQDYARETTSFRERPLIKYEDSYIPFVRLHSVFNTGISHPPLEKMILIRHQNKPMGILADSIIGNIQAVMKPLPPMFSEAPAISSSTILGDGSVGLILDVPELGALCRKEEEDYLNRQKNEQTNNSNSLSDG